MKLFKFNENFGAKANPWEELKVIITDDFEVDIKYYMGKMEIWNNILRCRAVEDTEVEFDSLIVSIRPNNDKFKVQIINKIKEINTHIEVEEDFKFLGVSKDLNSKPTNIDEIKPNDYFIFYLIYQIKDKSIRTCQNCIFRILEDEGYSNYTVTYTNQHCLKNQWGDNNVYDPTMGMDCKYFKENKNNKVSIHIEVEDDLKSCMWGSMDLHLG